MGLLPPDQIIREFFDGLDLKRFNDDLRLAEVQHHCTKNRDPKTCFMTVAFTLDGPIISWGFRLTKHLGTKEITLSEYFDLIHPAWKDFYHAAAQVAYTIAANEPGWARQPEACHIITVPLRAKGKKEYRWFRQVAIPVMVDPKKGMLAAHLNYYTDLGPYHGNTPEPPSVYALFPEDETENSLNRLYQQYATGLGAFSHTLIPPLSLPRQQILHAYQHHLWHHEKAPTLTELMVLLTAPEDETTDKKELKRRKENLKSNRTHLGKSLRNALQTEAPLAQPINFARLLNRFFGCPEGTTLGYDWGTPRQ